jgi:hypothetical protein
MRLQSRGEGAEAHSAGLQRASCAPVQAGHNGPMADPATPVVIVDDGAPVFAGPTTPRAMVEAFARLMTKDAQKQLGDWAWERKLHKLRPPPKHNGNQP